MDKFCCSTETDVDTHKNMKNQRHVSKCKHHYTNIISFFLENKKPVAHIENRVTKIALNDGDTKDEAPQPPLDSL